MLWSLEPQRMTILFPYIQHYQLNRLDWWSQTLWAVGAWFWNIFPLLIYIYIYIFVSHQPWKASLRTNAVLSVTVQIVIKLFSSFRFQLHFKFTEYNEKLVPASEGHAERLKESWTTLDTTKLPLYLLAWTFLVAPCSRDLAQVFQQSLYNSNIISFLWFLYMQLWKFFCWLNC